MNQIVSIIRSEPEIVVIEGSTQLEGFSGEELFVVEPGETKLGKTFDEWRELGLTSVDIGAEVARTHGVRSEDLKSLR